jgi:3-phenylpropionate/trans-cinnamate dioxygenase ferredoxin reductase subunit
LSDGRVVIVGAGHAGGSAAAFLRQYGHTGPIVLIGEEPLLPYQRPPLSKAWLKGEADAEALQLRPADFYDDEHITLKLRTEVVAIHRTAKTVHTSDGDVIPYDTLILATGSRARRLNVPGADLRGVLELRTAADAERLKQALHPGCRLAVVGGGYVGLEAAASARALGAAVTIVEREARVLARVAHPELSGFFERYHRQHGVEILCDAQVAGFDGDGGKVTAVRLADGRSVPCDLALVGVGGVAEDRLAQRAGLEVDGGVVVDDAARTSDPAIYAVGDVTRRPLPLYDADMRLESVPNALEQAKQAAAAIAGAPPPAPEVPWFWSDQYDLKLQIAGVPIGADETIVRGDPAAARFALFHLRAGRLLAVEAVNAPAEFMGGKLLIGRRALVDGAKLADMGVPMKAVAA